ncbi:MAG: 16S rRNA (adenine(1518)-N(6)/adenine(1519)-N(6))-dimethyltransferase RsmA [Coriobacteriales bacterium]|jgi:16S rRNA (adenine1518-N6/adenine1519-N6)-dimethyltransferase|nr:16S rRNA (adenine(1518)-N(6)/adenine(1519)-N(6))-dimethyltransferase RsmA [Coriobacteriales bacterium]
MTRYSSLASARATQQRLDELGLSAKKRLGQHFLVDDGIVGKILRLAVVEPESRIVEVGPGIGTLTEALLAQGAELIAVELDADLCAGLAARYPTVQLLCGDALAPQIVARLQELAPLALVANLPYGAAATILLAYFQALPSLQSATVMVQHEVADRIAAEPGGRDYGAYTVKLRLIASVAGRFKVSPQSFYPQPRVDSAVIRLERHGLTGEVGKVSKTHEARGGGSDNLLRTQGDGLSGTKGDAEDNASAVLVADASLLADAAFFQRRKTIRNSMQAYFARHELGEGRVDELLAGADIDPLARGETLEPETYLAMARALRARQAWETPEDMTDSLSIESSRDRPR